MSDLRQRVVAPDSSDVDRKSSPSPNSSPSSDDGKEISAADQAQLTSEIARLHPLLDSLEQRITEHLIQRTSNGPVREVRWSDSQMEREARDAGTD